MAARVRAYNWAATSLGPIERWPEKLKFIIDVVLTSGFPMVVMWGPDLVQIYNDGYRALMGVKHPTGLGQPTHECWPEVRHINAPIYERVWAGETLTFDDKLYPITRHGVLEDAWFTLSYSPLRGEGDATAGVLVTVFETTSRHHAEAALRAAQERQALLLKLTDAVRPLADPQAVQGSAMRVLGRHLGVNRAYYVEVLSDGDTLETGPGYVDGVVGITGRRKLSDYGGYVAAAFRAGKTIVSNDVLTDGRFNDPQGAGFAGIQMRAVIAVPLLKRESFVAALSVHQSTPRQWTSEEVSLVEEVAERTWDAVERARAEAALRDSEARFRALVEGWAQAVWETNAEGAVVTDSPSWRAFTGQTFDELSGFGWLQAIHPADRLFAERQWREAVATRRAVDADFRLHRNAGGWRWTNVRAAPLFATDGSVRKWVGMNIDISDRMRMQAALRESEARLRVATDAGGLGVWVWEPDTDRVIWENDHPYKIFKLEPSAEPLNAARFLAEFVHPDDAEAFKRAATQTLTSGEPFYFQGRARRTDGTPIWVEFSGQMRHARAGVPRAVLGTAADITERKQAEQVLRDADRRKDEFLAMLAHELRNPLAPIRTAAQVLRLLGSAEPRVLRTSEIIVRQVEHMTQIVDDLLDVSRVTRGLVELALEPIEFKEVVAAAVEQCRPLLDARRQHLTLQLPAEALRVNGDRLRLVQVLGNILNNAAKYTQEGGEIAVRVEAQPKTLTVSVLDNGGGIAAELLPHVFDLFTQASRSAARTQGGLGLGLALVKRLVELHGGVVTAHSEGPGRGSEFVIQLPRRMSASTDRADFPPTSPDCQGDGCAPLKVLVVDDNTDAADVLATLLQLQGHDVDVAYDSQDALERARVETPHVVLLDIGLPGMNGYELARLLRQQRITASATLIAITGYGQAEDRQRSRDAGFDYHLTKPVDPEALSDLLRELARSTPSSG